MTGFYCWPVATYELWWSTVDKILWYKSYLTKKPTSWVFLAPPEGLMQFLPSFNHAWQLLLAKFFDLVKLEFWPPGPPEPPGGQGSNLNSLFPALRHEGHTLSIWFGYYERFPRSFAIYGVPNKAKSTFKYLLDIETTSFFASHCTFVEAGSHDNVIGGNLDRQTASSFLLH